MILLLTILAIVSFLWGLFGLYLLSLNPQKNKFLPTDASIEGVILLFFISAICIGMVVIL